MNAHVQRQPIKISPVITNPDDVIVVIRRSILVTSALPHGQLTILSFVMICLDSCNEFPSKAGKALRLRVICTVGSMHGS